MKDSPDILVMMTSYRDVHLPDTVKSLRAAAVHPERLRFVICLQDCDPGIRDFLSKRDDCRVIEVDPEEHISLGSAFNLLREQAVSDDALVLYTEPHMHAVTGWDEYYTRQLRSLGDRAVISNYAHTFEYDGPLPDKPAHGYSISIGGIRDNDHLEIALGRPVKGPRPVRGCCVIGNNVFGPASFLRDCPMDVHMYMNLAETWLSLQLFTHGYDVYHTPEQYLYHYFATDESTKTGDPVRSAARRAMQDKDWKLGFPRFKRYLGIVDETNETLDLGSCIPGTARSVREFERFAGIDFQKRRLSRDALRGVYPAMEEARLDDDALKYYRYAPQPCDRGARERRRVLTELLQGEKALYIYGTGKASAFLRELLSYQRFEVRGIAVFGKTDEQVSTSPIFDLNGIAAEDPLILIAVRSCLPEALHVELTPSGLRVLRLDPMVVNSLLRLLDRDGPSEPAAEETT